jgi:hypothetical protein
MALTEKQEYKVEVVPPFQFILVRREDIILKDGVEISRSFQRHSLNPGDDYSSEPQVVQKVAAAVWDAQTIAAYEASLLAPEPEPNE